MMPSERNGQKPRAEVLSWAPMSGVCGLCLLSPLLTVSQGAATSSPCEKSSALLRSVFPAPSPPSPCHPQTQTGQWNPFRLCQGQLWPKNGNELESQNRTRADVEALSSVWQARAPCRIVTLLMTSRYVLNK